LLGLINKKAKQNDALIAFLSAIVVMSFVIILKLVAWTWFIFIGVSVTLVIGSLSALITQKITNNKKPSA